MSLIINYIIMIMIIKLDIDKFNSKALIFLIKYEI